MIFVMRHEKRKNISDNANNKKRKETIMQPNKANRCNIFSDIFTLIMSYAKKRQSRIEYYIIIYIHIKQVISQASVRRTNILSLINVGTGSPSDDCSSIR